jgi:hypothetical protein
MMRREFDAHAALVAAAAMRRPVASAPPVGTRAARNAAPSRLPADAYGRALRAARFAVLTWGDDSPAHN